ncbi:MAG: hypothetical protein ABI083_03815 [Lapillicoccus sp.]
MGQHYSGRHRPADSAPTSTRHRVPARIVRRPLLTTGAALALIGVSAAGYAKAGEAVTNSVATFALPTGAIIQADQRDNAQREQDSYRAQGQETTALRASVAADQAKAAAAAQAAALVAQRQAEADRAARDAARVSLIANAQKDPRAAARSLLAANGWTDSQWSCLDTLWAGESGWNYQAGNQSSGAYGIPQSLPASKMASVANDYRTNPITQITWGMNYIKNSYGSPCSALSTWNSRSPHWY